MIGDNKYLLIRRILESAGGTPLPGDLETDLLEKYLIIIGGTPSPGDEFNVLLRKIVIVKGGDPAPGDDEWDLLVKWLMAEGECRACGDSVYDLWRKILEMEEADPPVDPPVLNGLLGGLTVYWKLDEAAGNRVDSHGSYDLIENGSVGGIAGLLNGAANFPNTPADYLSNTSDDLNHHSAAFSISTWVRLNSIGGLIFGKGTVGQGGWMLDMHFQADVNFRFTTWDGDFNQNSVIHPDAIVDLTWYHIVAVYDGATTAHIWVNGVQATELVFDIGQIDTVLPFEMGKDLDSRVDETALWMGRALTNADVQILFNGGTPLPYPQFTV